METGPRLRFELLIDDASDGCHADLTVRPVNVPHKRQT